MISISMRVSDIFPFTCSKQRAFLFTPIKKIACNLVDTIYYSFFKIKWKEDGMGLSPSSFVGNLDWKDPQDNTFAQNKPNSKFSLKAEHSSSPMTQCLSRLQ